MLAKRIATALTLAPLVILGVLYLSPSWFSLVIGIMTCIASWEYCKLIKLSGFSKYWRQRDTELNLRKLVDIFAYCLVISIPPLPNDFG